MRHPTIKRVKWKKNISDFCSHVWYAGQRGKPRFVFSKNPVYTKSATFDMPGTGQTTFCFIQKSCLYKVISITVHWKNSDLVTKDMQPLKDMSTFSYADISYNVFSFLPFFYIRSFSCLKSCQLADTFKPRLPRSSRLTLSIFVQNIAFMSGGYSTKFYTGRLRPEVQPLTLNYVIFGRKGTPFTYLTRPQSSFIIWGGHETVAGDY